MESKINEFDFDFERNQRLNKGDFSEKRNHEITKNKYKPTQIMNIN